MALVISKLTPISYDQALIVAWASYTSFTLHAGSRGVIVTDTMMFMLILFVTFIAMYGIVSDHGGWFGSMDKLANLASKPDLMAWHGMTGLGLQFETPADFLIWLIIIMVAWSSVTAISPWQTSRYLIAKNEHVVLRSACLAAISVGVVQGMVYAIVPIINLRNPSIEPRDEVLIWAALNILTPFVGSLLIAGLVAAALSSASTFLSVIGFSVSHDLLRGKGADDPSKLKFSRRVMLAGGIATLVASLAIEQNIFWLTYFAGTLFASAWGSVALMSVWSRHITAKAAFWGITCGFSGNVIPKLLVTMNLISLPVYLDPIVIGSVASLAAVLLVSSKTSVTIPECEYRLSLLKVPAEEVKSKEAKRTLLYASAVGVFGIIVTILLLIFYVVPYQKASASVHSDLDFNWFSGEALFAYAWTALFVSMSWLIRRGVQSSYLPRPPAAHQVS